MTSSLDDAPITSIAPINPTTTSAAAHDDASQLPTANSSLASAQQSAVLSSHTTDSLSHSKEKARNLMSSSGARSTQTPPNGNPLKPPALSNGASRNATPASRKRSRSGSRIDASNTAKPSDYVGLSLHQYIAHDQVHAAAKVRDGERLKILEQGLKEERKAWEEYHRKRIFEAQRRHTRPVYQSEKRPVANRKALPLRVTGRHRQEQAEQIEQLAPIRLDIEFEKLRLRDTFTWNITDQVVNPQTFVAGLIEDFKLPSEAHNHFLREAHKSLVEQIEDFHPHPAIVDDALDSTFPYAAYKNDEIRVQIKLNITIGQHQLTDQFDWDINNSTNSPEQFARQMARDMSLSGDFTTAIAASIHEQIQPYTKALYMTGHEFDGRVPESTDIRDHLLPSPLNSSFRTFMSAKDCTPSFFELDEKNQYAQELSYDREQRQQKRSGNRGIDPRSGRGGGPTLPDLKERPQVNRTRVVASTIPGAAESIEKSGIYRMTHKKKRPWNAGRGMGRENAEESDSDLEASSSDGESPIRGAAHLLGGGTSRTRGMRGAAAAAQSAMRRNYNDRTPSPEAEKEKPQQNKFTSLRFKADPIWEDYDSQDERVGLTVKIKVPRERFRQWWREWKKNLPMREQEMQRRRQLEMMQAQSRTTSATPGPGQLMGPPSTPGLGGGRGLPGGSGTPKPASGMTPTPPPGMNIAPHVYPPPPPAWLAQAVDRLRVECPNDRFEGTMRMNKDVPEGHPEHWQPRIRCFDCSGTLYNVSPNDLELTNFRSHLKFSKHVKAREERIRREQGTG
ncbi:MAG: hypothetical protein Q9159_001748 [Coniocarpon cinnabarinum]